MYFSSEEITGSIHTDPRLNVRFLGEEEIGSTKVRFEKMKCYLKVDLGPNSPFGRIEPGFSINVEILAMDAEPGGQYPPVGISLNWDTSLIYANWCVPGERERRVGLGLRSIQPDPLGVCLVFDDDDVRKNVIIAVEKSLVEINRKFSSSLQLLFCTEAEIESTWAK